MKYIEFAQTLFNLKYVTSLKYYRSPFVFSLQCFKDKNRHIQDIKISILRRKILYYKTIYRMDLTNILSSNVEDCVEECVEIDIKIFYKICLPRKKII